MISFILLGINSSITIFTPQYVQQHQFFLCRICLILVAFWPSYAYYIALFLLLSLNLALSLLANSNSLASLSSIVGLHDEFSITNNYNERLAGTAALFIEYLNQSSMVSS